MKNYKIIFLISIQLLLGLRNAFSQNYYVPLSVLISNPEKFNNTVITLEGYLHYRFEDHQLYTSKESAAYLMSGGVWITNDSIINKEIKFPDFNNKYVSITGVFVCNKDPYRSPYQGNLIKISSIKILRKWD